MIMLRNLIMLTALFCWGVINYSYAEGVEATKQSVTNEDITKLNRILNAERDSNNQTNRKAKDANFEQGLIFYRQGDYSQAFNLFFKANQSGHPKAASYIGLMYLKGQGVKENPDIAFGYFVLAAQRGDVIGQYWLGYMYETGTGVNQDMRQALRWYNVSARKGDILAAPALTALGRVYEYGLGNTAKDLDKAREYYLKAANDGYLPAQQALNNLNARAQMVAQPDVSRFLVDDSDDE